MSGDNCRVELRPTVARSFRPHSPVPERSTFAVACHLLVPCGRHAPPPPPAVLRSLNIVDLPASHCPFPPPSPFKETPFYVRYFTHIQLVHRRITNSSWFPSVSSPRGRALPLPLLHFRTLSPRAPSPILHSHKENPKTAAATA